MAAGIALRFAASVHLWLDEAQTVNIAHLPLADLRGALRRDGAPPLFYAMLHFWSRVFGGSDHAVRALPGVLGVLAILPAYACGRRVAGSLGADAEPAGIATALIVALSPFAIRYSTETRMYSLAMALVLVAHLAVWRAIEAPTLRRLALLAIVTAALLYTEYWCAFLVMVVVAVLGVRFLTTKGDERRTAGRVIAGIVGGGVLFLPWAPTFLWQLHHTGTPWAPAPDSPVVVLTTFTQFAGGHYADARALTVALALLAALGFRGRNGRSARWECLVGAATLGLGLLTAVVTGSAYQVRYAAIVFPLVALAAGRGVSLLGRNVRIAVLVVIVALGITTGRREIHTLRTQAGEVAAAIRSGAHSGDVVVYCPDQLAPDTSRLLPASLPIRQYTFPGFGSPGLVDWVDYADRNRAADPDAFVRELATRAGSGDIWLVSSAGYLTYDGLCERLQADLASRRGHGRRLVTPSKSDVVEHMGLIRFGG